MSKPSSRSGISQSEKKDVPVAQPSKWLVFRLSSLGDVVLTTGPMRYWHQKNGWTFTVLTKPAFAPVFENNPAVHALITPQKEQIHLPAMPGYFRKIAASHQNEGMLDLHGTIRSRLLGMFWQGPVMRYQKFSAQRRSYVLRKSPKTSQALLEYSVTQRYAMATGELPPMPENLLPAIYLTSAETQAAKSRLHQVQSSALFSPGQGRAVALHPYATHFRKAWPANYWIQLTRELDRHNINWFIVGQGDGIFPGDPRDFTGQTSLRELCALLAEARVLVTGDSGPMHLASAVGTPVLAMFGPTTREWGFFPAGKEDQVLESDLSCRPCSLHGADRCRRNGECMRKITPDLAMNRLLAMLGIK